MVGLCSFLAILRECISIIIYVVFLRHLSFCAEHVAKLCGVHHTFPHGSYNVVMPFSWELGGSAVDDFVFSICFTCRLKTTFQHRE